jgi:nitrite reductase (NADH) small subunit
MSWIRVAASDQFPQREGRRIVIGGREIAIFNLGDRFFAVDNQCPHRGGPLCDGIVAGGAVVCPLHAWKVNLDSGTVERPADANACTRAYEARVQDGIVSIDVPSAEVRSAGHAA